MFKLIKLLPFIIFMPLLLIGYILGAAGLILFAGYIYADNTLVSYQSKKEKTDA